MARAVSRPRTALRFRSTSHSSTKKSGPRTKKPRSRGAKPDPHTRRHATRSSRGTPDLSGVPLPS